MSFSSPVKKSPIGKTRRYKYKLGKAAKKLCVIQPILAPGDQEILDSVKKIITVEKVVNIPKPLSRTNSVPKVNNPESAGPTNGAYANFLRGKMELPDPNKGKPNYPTKGDLIKSIKFGKPDKDHIFDSEKVFETVSIHIFKSGFLSQIDCKNLRGCRVDLEILQNMITWANYIDFSPLRAVSIRYKTQECISEERTRLLTACAIHYDFHIPSVIRYLGGEYIGQHLDLPTIIDCLVDHDCPEEIVQDLERILTAGCPAKLVADDTRKNFLEYWKYGNHLTIAANMDKVMKMMNKEDKNSFIWYCQPS